MSEQDYAALPAAVRKQAEEADKLQAELAAAQTGNTGNEPPVEPPKAPEDSPAPEMPEPGKEAAPAAEPGPPPGSSPVSPQQPGDTKPDEDDWKVKYLVLQGKYNAEVPRLAELVKTLQGEVDALKAGKPAEPKKDDEPKPTPVPEINLQDYEDFPDEIQALVNSIVGLTRQNKELTDRLAKTEGQAGAIVQNQAKTDRQRFWDAVDERVPDWDAINKDPGFIGWLNEVDPFSGLPRQKLLEDATARMDVNRHVLFFDQFKREKGLANPPPAKAGQTPGKPGIENQVVPGRSSSGAPPSGPAQTITPEQFQQAAAQYTRGRIPKAEYDKIEAAFNKQMEAAHRQGK